MGALNVQATFASQALGAEPGESDSWVIISASKPDGTPVDLHSLTNQVRTSTRPDPLTVFLAASVLGVGRTALRVLQIDDLGEGFVAVRVERDDGSSQGGFGSLGTQAIGVVVVSGADRGQTLAMPPLHDIHRQPEVD
jgi:hypothetical protein